MYWSDFMRVSLGNISVSSKTNGSKKYTGVSEKLKEEIQKWAKEGASKGVYMGEKYAAFIQKYRNAHVSPDYSKLKMQLLGRLNTLKSRGCYKSRFLMKMSGFSCSLEIGSFHDYISVRNGKGDILLSYDSRQGWSESLTDDELRFHKETTAIYSEAYSATRAAMREQGYLTADGVTLQGFDAKA
jgi:hypothetical protein